MTPSIKSIKAIASNTILEILEIIGIESFRTHWSNIAYNPMISDIQKTGLDGLVIFMLTTPLNTIFYIFSAVVFCLSLTRRA